MKNPVLKGGSFYDCETPEDGTDHTEDFTLRDLFAGAALTGIMRELNWSGQKWQANYSDVALICYNMADEMLSARAKQLKKGE